LLTRACFTIIALMWRLLILSILPSSVLADSAWVSDQFEITLRSGPSTSNAIEMMLASGTEVEVIERNEDTGYTLVRTRGGTEGYVITRYLMREPAAREQLETLTRQLTSATTEGSSLQDSLASVRSEYAAANRKIDTLEFEKSSLQEELDTIKRTAANALSLDRQNTELRETLKDTEVQLAALEQENRALASQVNRYWFIAGAGVLVAGILLGLWLPRMRMPKRSRYDRL